MRWLVDGNAEFVALATLAEGRHVVPIDLADLGLAAPGQVVDQHPFAVVVGCSDARVPTELVFNRRCDELFVVRVAGNVLGPEQLGSVDYAIGHLGDSLKLIVVLGHSQCGAVTAAVDMFITPVEYLELSSSHQIRSIVNALFPAVRGAARSLAVRWGEDVTSRPAYRAALIETAVAINAALMASILRENFAVAGADLRAVFGVYDLASRRVHVPSAAAAGEPAVLLEAPTGQEEFRAMALRIVESDVVRTLLGV
ncbi:MAG: hypothetical protein IPK07_25730 [Deltaproteobacteria bacterium]|nr:hypothetical protein [Deltaproteobacteria bacterium]